MRPNDFWTSDFDEIREVVEGKVENWRYDRRNAWAIRSATMAEPGDMMASLPLPFDDDLGQDISESAKIVELYEYANSINYFGR